MNCATHPDREAAGYCRNCGKALCAECTRNVRGVLYCESCLAAMVPQVPPSSHVDGPNPGIAATLGFIPGLGAVYNGEYVKGLIHVAIFAGVIAILNNQSSDSLGAFFGIGLACFYFYMPIEAYRTAKMRQQAAFAQHYGQAAPAAAPAPGAAPMNPEGFIPPGAAGFAGAPVAGVAPGAPGVPSAGPTPGAVAPQIHSSRNPLAGAVVLIALGVLVLMSNLGWLTSDWFGYFWPLLLIGIGVWLLWKRFNVPAGKGSQQP